MKKNWRIPIFFGVSYDNIMAVTFGCQPTSMGGSLGSLGHVPFFTFSMLLFVLVANILTTISHMLHGAGIFTNIYLINHPVL